MSIRAVIDLSFHQNLYAFTTIWTEIFSAHSWVPPLKGWAPMTRSFMLLYFKTIEPQWKRDCWCLDLSLTSSAQGLSFLSRGVYVNRDLLSTCPSAFEFWKCVKFKEKDLMTLYRRISYKSSYQPHSQWWHSSFAKPIAPLIFPLSSVSLHSETHSPKIS